MAAKEQLLNAVNKLKGVSVCLYEVTQCSLAEEDKFILSDVVTEFRRAQGNVSAVIHKYYPEVVAGSVSRILDAAVTENSTVKLLRIIAFLEAADANLKSLATQLLLAPEEHLLYQAHDVVARVHDTTHVLIERNHPTHGNGDTRQ